MAHKCLDQLMENVLKLDYWTINSTNGSLRQKMAEDTLAVKKSRKRPRNSNLDGKDWPGRLSPQTPGPRCYLPGLLLWLAQTNPGACHHVLQTYQRQKGHASWSGHQQLPSTHRIAQTAEDADRMAHEIGYAVAIFSRCTAAVSTVAHSSLVLKASLY